jgi:hypothetical protein
MHSGNQQPAGISRKTLDDRARKYIPPPYLINGGTFTAKATIFDKKTPQGNLCRKKKI